jgi:hypothetical protein
MSRYRLSRSRVVAVVSLMTLAAGCDTAAPPGDAGSTATAPSAVAGLATGHVIRHYGMPARVGDGTARTYVLVNSGDRNAPIEVGVALSDRAMEGLPQATGGASHGSMVINLLALPVHNPTPYRFVELDWNPAGHEPAAIYGIPHFDFHFYTTSREIRSSIVPTSAGYSDAAATLPAEGLRPAFYLDAPTATGLPAALVTVPLMGLHWFDVRSPELQGQPFTRTFIKGSWDGQFIFDEPMITRAWLLTRRISSREAAADEIIPVSTAERYEPGGWYPSAYRIAYDPQAREFLVGLTQLAWRE